MVLLDTCIFSEFSKKQPDRKVLEWAASIPERDIYLSVLVLGELLRGIERLDEGRRKTSLREWVQSLWESHKSRLIPVDSDVVSLWAVCCSRAEKQGIVPKAIDSLIAASALSRGVALATRNERDFVGVYGVQVINPFNKE